MALSYETRVHSYPRKLASCNLDEELEVAPSGHRQGRDIPQDARIEAAIGLGSVPKQVANSEAR